MLKAIKKSFNFHNAVFSTGDKFTIKFKLSVLDENYVFDKLIPYCTNCSSSPIMMSKYGYGDYICNCGKSLDYDHIKFIRSRILTDVEKFEK